MCLDQPPDFRLFHLLEITHAHLDRVGVRTGAEAVRWRKPPGEYAYGFSVTAASTMERGRCQAAMRFDELQEGTAELENHIEQIQKRHQSVERVGRELDRLCDCYDDARRDAQRLAESTKDVADTKEKLDEILQRTDELDNRIRAIDSKRSSIYEAEFKIDNLQNHDIEARVENFKGQKAVIDHVSEKISQLDFTIKQAEVTTKALEDERTLALRIHEGVNDTGRDAAPLNRNGRTSRA